MCAACDNVEGSGMPLRLLHLASLRLAIPLEFEIMLFPFADSVFVLKKKGFPAGFTDLDQLLLRCVDTGLLTQ